MRGQKSEIVISLSPEEKERMEHLLRSPNTPLGIGRRCRAVLMRAEGKSITEIARVVDLTEKHVRKWLRRFRQERLNGLRDKSRPGRPPVFSPSGGVVHHQGGV